MYLVERGGMFKMKTIHVLLDSFAMTNTAYTLFDLPSREQVEAVVKITDISAVIPTTVSCARATRDSFLSIVHHTEQAWSTMAVIVTITSTPVKRIRWGVCNTVNWNDEVCIIVQLAAHLL